jgi:DNA-binding transcriptional MerR regulator/effector-binding domain-containing protein
MTVLVTIGDFSRMTHLSVKALRHYHDVGLLEPADVDPSSGYRLYDADQVPLAQVIRRFRDLGMPVDEVRSMLQAPDLETRNKVIIAHLERMESQLAATTATVTSLKAMLESPGLPRSVEYRAVGASHVLAVTSRVHVDDFIPWWAQAFAGLREALLESGLTRTGPDGALYPSEFFELEQGDVTAFVPVTGDGAGVAGLPEVELIDIPGAEYAVMLHEGPFEDLDRAYGELGAVVAERAIGVEGPIREHYLLGPFDTRDENSYRTEVHWPVFRTVR